MHTELPPSNTYVVTSQFQINHLVMVYSYYCHQGSLKWHKSGTQRCNQNTCVVDGIFKKSIIMSGERKPIYQTLKPEPPPTHITLAIASTLNRFDILNLNLYVHLCRLIDFCHEIFHQKEYVYSGSSHSSLVILFFNLFAHWPVLEPFAQLLFSNVFAHLLLFKLFAHLLFSHLPFSNCFVSYTFSCSSISFAHELLFKLFTHVLELFLIFVC